MVSERSSYNIKLVILKHISRIDVWSISCGVVLRWMLWHYDDVKMSAMASQITSLTIVYSTVYSRHRSKKTSKLRVTGLCAGNSPGPVNSPHKGPVTRKMFPFDNVIMRPYWWLVNIGRGAFRHQAITSTSVDLVLWYHMASLGHNELVQCNLQLQDGLFFTGTSLPFFNANNSIIKPELDICKCQWQLSFYNRMS